MNRYVQAAMDQRGKDLPETLEEFNALPHHEAVKVPMPHIEKLRRANQSSTLKEYKLGHINFD